MSRLVLYATITLCSLSSLPLALNAGAEHSVSFKEETKKFPQGDQDLRKWDSPTVADLDQDGYMDLLLNEHGYTVKVLWNNRGRFSKPYDIIIGDMHGLSVADFDKDGLQELIISRGGGSGSNARNSVIYRVGRDRSFTRLDDFDEPLAFMRGRTVKFYDGDNDGHLDLVNFAFPDKTKKGQSENYIYKNNGEGQLVLESTLPPSKGDGQKTLLTDFDGDNVVDLILYGHGKILAYKGKGDLTYDDVTDSIFPEAIKDVTGIVELDYDQDGDFDLYLTRGKDFEPGETYYDKDSSTLGFFTKRGKFQFDDFPAGDIIELENIQSQWPHKSLFIGESAYEYEFPGETHSGRNLRLVISDGLGWPDQLIEKGAYIGYIGNGHWRLAGNIWSPFTGIIRGVTDYTESEHNEGLTDMLLQNNGGTYTDVSAKAGISLKEHTTGVAVADLDNNGSQDLVVVRRGSLVRDNQSIIYMNQGDGTFAEQTEHEIISNVHGAIGMGVETLDYDKDGRVDVILGNERGKWHLFHNTSSNDNNYLVVEVGSSKDGNASAKGALVTVENGGKKQTQRVGATGANYSTSFDTFVHFGLGSQSAPSKITVTWPNGENEERIVKAANETVTIGAK